MIIGMNITLGWIQQGKINENNTQKEQLLMANTILIRNIFWTFHFKLTFRNRNHIFNKISKLSVECNGIYKLEFADCDDE